MADIGKSTQSPTAWQRVKLAVAAGAGLVGFDIGAVYAANTLGLYLHTLGNAYTAFVAALATSAGAASVGFDIAVGYAYGTIGRIIADGPVNAMWFLSSSERAQVLAGGDTIDLTAKLEAAKDFAFNRDIYLPAGTWSISSFDGKLWYGALIGDGIGNTIIKCRSAVTNLIDLDEVADVIVSPCAIKKMTIDGNSLATNGINVQFRHYTTFDDLYIVNCTNGVVEKDAWNNKRTNCMVRACTTGWTLTGSNHATVFTGCTFAACSTMQLVVDDAGTAVDGNSGLQFTNCLVVDGDGQGMDITCSNMTWTGGYLGENILGGVMVIMRAGILNIDGGSLFFGASATGYLFAPVGGKVIVTGAEINAQTFGSTALLNSTNTGGKWSLRDCQCNITVGGDQVLLGDVLDYGPPGLVFANRLGRTLASSANNATRTELLSGNAITCTCATAPGPTPNITITALLSATRPQWREGENLYLVVVYLSNADFVARLSGSAFGGAPTTTIGTLPSTGGATRTYVKVDASIAANNYDRIEFYRDNCAVNDFLKIEEVFVADSRMLNKGAGNIGNLFKC